jgi:hypothetical protein
MGDIVATKYSLEACCIFGVLFHKVLDAQARKTMTGFKQKNKKAQVFTCA